MICHQKNIVEIWNDIKDLIGKDFDVEVIPNNKNISTKMKFFEDEVRINFQDEGLLLEKTSYLIHSIILNDSIYRSDKSYCSQILIENLKRHLTEDLSYSDSYSNFYD